MSTSPYLLHVHFVILIDDSKSQLAIQYAHSIRDEAPQTFVFWVHASTQARFEEAYRDIADRLQLPGRSDPRANVLRLVRDWLRDEKNGRWVMIIDNADDIDVFFPSRKRQRDEVPGDPPTSLATYLPQSCNGSILVTSRSKNVASRLAGGYNRINEVPAMDKGESLQLLRMKLGDSPLEERATDLLRALDYIPLAITQAAAYINQSARMTVAGYLNEFQRNNKKRESLLNWDEGELRRDESASNSVVTTWQMSFEQIRHERQSAADLLSLMSFFNPQGIPESTLRRYSKDAAGAAAFEDDSAFDKDLNILVAYSLVSMSADSDACEMHALVQFCTRVWLSSFSDAEQWEQRFVALMAEELPNGEYKNWVKCQLLLPHVEPLFDSEVSAEETLKPWARVLTNAAWYLNEKGSYTVAQQLATKALAAREKVLGPDHHNTLVSVTVLAGGLQAQGKHKEAEMLHRRALEGFEKELGKGHPDTLGSMNNLAVILRCQGKYEEAEMLNRRALEVSKKELGKGHPDTLTGMNNLAVILRCQGKYEEAEMLNRQSLEVREKELGKGHPDTLTITNNLAVILWSQKKYEEAETLNRRALEGFEKELGKDHPSTLVSVYHLARLLHKLLQYTEAVELYQRACDGFTEQLGSDHPYTVGCHNEFAAMRQELDQARLLQGDGPS
jgi:tetratricopeptide (TPR) repeat protein